MLKLLFMEDEKTIRSVLSEYMRLAAYEVTAVGDGHAALQAIAKTDFDLAVLDIMVPGPDGLEVLQELRSSTPTCGIIMLSALSDEETQLSAFSQLADDYVIKPTSPLLLIKRLEAIVRRKNSYANQAFNNTNTTSLQHDNTTAHHEKTAPLTSSDKGQGLYINKDAYIASWDGRDLQLTLSEFLLLSCLAEQPERSFTREQLIEYIYNEEYPGSDRIIDAHIKNIRKKLPLNCIATVIGVGYRFKLED